MRLLPVLIFASSTLLACHDHEHSGVGREPDEYLGCATDELWPVFDANEALALASPDATAAPKLTAPALTAALPATAPRFVWSKQPSAQPVLDGDVPITCEQFTRGAITTQHLEPVSGTVYQLRLFAGIGDGATVDYRVLTTLEQWQPPAALWERLRGTSRRIEIMRMPVVNNERTAGPFVSPDQVTFMVLPQ